MTNFVAAYRVYIKNNILLYYERGSEGGAVWVFFIGRAKEFRIVGSFQLFVCLLYTHQRVTPNGFSCVSAGRGRASAYRRRRPSQGSNTFHGTLIGPTARHYQQEESEKKNLVRRKTSDRHHPSQHMTAHAAEISGAENF